jgi:SulP family sulfate permease
LEDSKVARDHIEHQETPSTSSASTEMPLGHSHTDQDVERERGGMIPRPIDLNRQSSVSASTPATGTVTSSVANALGRSFVYNSFRPSIISTINAEMLQIHSTDSVHEDSADLANIAVPDIDDDHNETYGPFFENIDSSASPSHDESVEDMESANAEYPTTYDPTGAENESYQAHANTLNESSSILVPPQERESTFYGSTSNSLYPEPEFSPNYDIEAMKLATIERRSNAIKEAISFFKNSNTETLLQECVYRPIGYMPAVFLGTLLNVLDALSYGMIMFPIGEAVFSKMGPAGLSMFYVSTVISQLVFSLGGSAFKGGIGSEMIEVTPFFHQMGLSILYKIQSSERYANDPNTNNVIITTTIFAFAISSMVTGLVFAVLGKCRLGKLVGFFPRHILVGCIGGVGYFLFITGIEVSSRIEGGVNYNWPTLQYLLNPLPFLQWTIPLILSVVLIIIQKINSHPLIVPCYFIVIFIVFHLLILIIPSWNIQLARDYGWIFSAQESNEPWYSFYKYYNFKICDWWLILDQLPTMFALTFFGVLHVPINVPALALTVGMDTYDVDRELIAHGISNFVSGMLGSIQNYLVYTNSVLFIRSGADSHLSGVLLAFATSCIMFIGPVLIGYIPVCVVGSLIYLLGYELLKESVWDTYGRLRKFEYITIIIIVITMGAWDFVYGILVGILLACVSFVIEAGSKSVISDVYTGEYARSIVVRHPKQLEFLKNVGKQICILKLSGSLFFGSIGGLEERIRNMFEVANYRKQPIKYLILDLNNVLTFDFSATEGFKRIRNLLMERNCYFILSSVKEDGKSNIVESLKFSGLWETEEHQEKIQMFNTLNSALEWCENRFLKNYKDFTITAQSKHMSIGNNINNNRVKKLPVAGGVFENYSTSQSPIIGTPRHVQFMNAARKYKQNEQLDRDLILSKIDSCHNNNNTTQHIRKGSQSTMKQPLYLILQIMQGLSTRHDDKFWSKLIPYLKKQTYKPGDDIYDKNSNQPRLFFFESGLIDFQIKFNDLKFTINSSELPLTMFGDIIITNSDRSIKYTANTSCVVWILGSKFLEKLKADNSEVYEELLAVFVRVSSQRFESITSNILIS